MNTVIKSVSFTEEYIEELNFFMLQPNKSRYICELIRKDRLREIEVINKMDIEHLKEEMIQEIDKRLKNLPTAESEGGNTDIRDSLLDLFGDFN